MNIDIGIQKPKNYKLEGSDEYIRLVLEKMDSTHEGIVVRDRYFNRIIINLNGIHKMRNTEI